MYAEKTAFSFFSNNLYNSIFLILSPAHRQWIAFCSTAAGSFSNRSCCFSQPKGQNRLCTFNLYIICRSFHSLSASVEFNAPLSTWKQANNLCKSSFRGRNVWGIVINKAVHGVTRDEGLTEPFCPDMTLSGLMCYVFICSKSNYCMYGWTVDVWSLTCHCFHLQAKKVKGAAPTLCSTCRERLL